MKLSIKAHDTIELIFFILGLHIRRLLLFLIGQNIWMLNILGEKVLKEWFLLKIRIKKKNKIYSLRDLPLPVRLSALTHSEVAEGVWGGRGSPSAR